MVCNCAEGPVKKKPKREKVKKPKPEAANGQPAQQQQQKQKKKKPTKPRWAAAWGQGQALIGEGLVEGMQVLGSCIGAWALRYCHWSITMLAALLLEGGESLGCFSLTTLD